jgi:hypothetical protein
LVLRGREAKREEKKLSESLIQYLQDPPQAFNNIIERTRIYSKDTVSLNVYIPSRRMNPHKALLEQKSHLQYKQQARLNSASRKQLYPSWFATNIMGKSTAVLATLVVDEVPLPRHTVTPATSIVRNAGT